MQETNIFMQLLRPTPARHPKSRFPTAPPTLSPSLSRFLARKVFLLLRALLFYASTHVYEYKSEKCSFPSA